MSDNEEVNLFDDIMHCGECKLTIIFDVDKHRDEYNELLKKLIKKDMDAVRFNFQMWLG